MEEQSLTEDSTPEMCEAMEQIEEHEKNYYCQRCLNHGEFNPRKGHKPDCGYLKCPCPECTMVEQRRQLNNLLSKKKVHIAPTTQTRNGKRVRDPHCARCSAHGVLVPLRGHKRSMCQFVTCTCTLCALVENRRMLMAAQIKLRRLQQKTRDGKEVKKEKRGGKKREELKLAEHIEQETSNEKRTVPIHPLNLQLSMLQQAQNAQTALLLMNYLQTPPLPGSPLLFNEQFAALASMYLKGCLKI